MMSIFKVWSKGRKYLETWPLESKLGMIFPENRIIRATKFAQNIMPMFAVFALCWPYFYGYSLMTTSASLLTALAALCLPLQGLYWLGKRATTTLPPQSAVWFDKISAQLAQQNIALTSPQGQPTYQDLAERLNKAQQHLPRSFWQEL